MNLYELAGAFFSTLVFFALSFNGAALAATDVERDAEDNVVWGGDKSDKQPITHTLVKGSSESFAWTNGEKDKTTGDLLPHPGYVTFTRTDTGADRTYKFFRPDDKTIADWVQSVEDSKGNTSKTHGAALKHDSPWQFHSLADLSAIGWKIPDFAPTSLVGLTIYTAVNLDLYLASNPLGPSGGKFEIGQTLDELGIRIVDGQIIGLFGIYFSTTDFTFDPDSALGFVPIGGLSAFLNSDEFQATNGSIGILGIHSSGIPEPPILLVLGTGALILWPLRSRRRWPQPSSHASLASSQCSCR